MLSFWEGNGITLPNFLNSLHTSVKNSDSDVIYSQVWWPILGIRALHLPIQSAHTQQWTQVHAVNTPPGNSWGFSALLKGTSLWYWRCRERCTFTPSNYNTDQDSNLQLLNYKSDSLTIRPRTSTSVMLSNACKVGVSLKVLKQLIYIIKPFGYLLLYILSSTGPDIK